MRELTRREWLVTVGVAAAGVVGAKFGLDGLASPPPKARTSGASPAALSALKRGEPVDFDSGDIGPMSLEEMVVDGDNVTLTAKGKDIRDKTREVLYTIRLVPEDKGTYVQSEDWAEKLEEVKWEGFQYSTRPELFNQKADVLNRVVGKLAVAEDGTYTIASVTRIALYDGLVNKVAQASQTVSGIVTSMEDKPAGARVVTLFDIKTKQQVQLWFFGNRLYDTPGGLQPPAKQPISKWDRLEANVRAIEGYNDGRIPPAEQVAGALGVFTYSKKGRERGWLEVR